jgi:YidC/Oxa1 family membrane protein insertase
MVIANVLQPLIDVAEAILTFWHDQAGFSWGWSIVMLTVVVRLAILPLTFKSVRGMQELQRLQPEMKRLQERYKDDKQRLNQEMVKFYQEHKVNPLSSCLPILLQLPFFLALFYLLRSDSFEADIQGEESFFFINDLAAPATGGDLVILIVVYVASMLASTMITAVTADKTQRYIFLALPFIFIPFIITFEAGLLVYWITTNIWTIGQQLLVRKLFPKPEPIQPREEGPKPARGKPVPAGAAAAVGSSKGSGGSSKGGGNGDGAAPQRKAPPPRSPRKKKKRSGRRR